MVIVLSAVHTISGRLVLALIDYDNVDRVDKSRGLLHIGYLVADAIGSAPLSDGTGLTLRLYGGWYQGSALSKGAQNLVAEIARTFPAPLTISDRVGVATFVVRAELAHTLLFDPAHVLTHTYRPRSLPPTLTAQGTPFLGCTNPTGCPLAPVAPFLAAHRCPSPGCPAQPSDVLERAEQKLVDSMLVCDLIHAARTASPKPVGLVSTDEDLLPGVRLALLEGGQVIHIHPRRGRRTPKHYGHILTSAYREASF